jgi:hypothetical protein
MRGWIRKYWTIFSVGLLVLRVRLLLRFLSLPHALGVLEPKVERSPYKGVPLVDLIYYTDRWLLLFPYNAKGNCFPRSVTLYRCARQAGFPVRLHCGVRKSNGTLDGHAWLTLDGAPFHELSRQWQHFTVTFSYPGDTHAMMAKEQSAHG